MIDVVDVGMWTRSLTIYVAAANFLTAGLNQPLLHSVHQIEWFQSYLLQSCFDLKALPEAGKQLITNYIVEVIVIK
jgi:hypothetical protein